MLSFAPQPIFHFHHQQAPRDRYLRALAEEEAARRAYVNNLANQYSNLIALHDYRDDHEAGVREFYRQQQLKEAARARAEQEYRHRQAAIAELRDRMFNDTLAQKYHGPAEKISDHCGDMTQHQALPSCRRPMPSLEQQMQAAKSIQAHWRKHIQRRNALRQISSIRKLVLDVVTEFRFPANPEFEPNTSTPTLLYSSVNTPIHAFENSLLKLLSNLDGIETLGDLRIRQARRTLAKSIEKALSGLDALKAQAWKRQHDLAVPSATNAVSAITPLMTDAEVSALPFDGDIENLVEVSDSIAHAAHELALPADEEEAHVAESDVQSSIIQQTLASPSTPSATMSVSEPTSFTDSGTINADYPFATQQAFDASLSSPDQEQLSNTPSSNDAFLEHAFDVPIDEALSIASFPVQNDMIDQEEVEDMVLVDVEEKSSADEEEFVMLF